MICYTHSRIAAETSGGEREARGAVAERLRRVQQFQAEEGRGDTRAEREDGIHDQKGDVPKSSVCFTSLQSLLLLFQMEAYSPERFSSIESDLESCRAQLSSATSENSELRHKFAECDLEKCRLGKELEEANAVRKEGYDNAVYGAERGLRCCGKLRGRSQGPTRDL